MKRFRNENGMDILFYDLVQTRTCYHCKFLPAGWLSQIVVATYATKFGHNSRLRHAYRLWN